MNATDGNGWPAWWHWELELTSHVLKRMVDRRISEIDLRRMMDSAMDIRVGDEQGRWIVETSHESRPWAVVVEPDARAHLLVVVTAYPVGAP